MGKLSKTFFQELQSHYRDIGMVIHYEAIPQGSANSNYRVRTQTGNYFLKIIARQQEANLGRQLSFYRALSNSNIETICPIKNKEGDNVTHISGQKILLFPYMNITEPKITLRNAEALGRLTAALHNTAVSSASQLEQAKYNKKACLIALEGLNEVRRHKYLPYIEHISSIKDNLPKGFVFDDICPDNLYADKHSIRGFIDPENAGIGEYIFDIAGALIMCCFPRRNKFQLTRLFLQAYTKKRAHTKQEHDFLFEALIMVCVWLCLFFESRPSPAGHKKIAERLGYADMLLAMGRERFYRAIGQ
ncbi:MAG TPA: phosphotransferase [Rickettsiales bacterium]|nr:phosphotransferase [Rickettsiales bacterium]